MKHYFQKPVNTHGVAPHTGAWIETHVIIAVAMAAIVAPHTGAWIETQ